MSWRTRDDKGFSLVELCIVLVVMGILFSMGIPALLKMNQSQQLRGTSETLVSAIMLQRTRAMATGSTVTINFNNTANPGWTVMSQGMSVKRKFPKGVTYQSVAPTTINITRDGRINTSALVVLQNRQSNLDTVSVMVSGLALIR